jgi:hypothetical protein
LLSVKEFLSVTGSSATMADLALVRHRQVEPSSHQVVEVTSLACPFEFAEVAASLAYQAAVGTAYLVVAAASLGPFLVVATSDRQEVVPYMLLAC